MMGNYDDSADFYQKCIEIEPNEFDFHAKKANSFFNLGKYDQAMLAINKSLDLNANDSLMIDLKSLYILGEKMSERKVNLNEVFKVQH